MSYMLTCSTDMCYHHLLLPELLLLLLLLLISDNDLVTFLLKAIKGNMDTVRGQR